MNLHATRTDFYTVSGAALLLAQLGCPVSPATVRVWADRGKLPAIRTVNGVRLFRRADVEHVAAERRSEEIPA